MPQKAPEVDQESLDQGLRILARVIASHHIRVSVDPAAAEPPQSNQPTTERPASTDCP